MNFDKLNTNTACTFKVGRLLWVGVIVMLLLAACGRGQPQTTSVPQVPGGNPQRGWQTLQDYGCHSCHTIPGVPGANAFVGPPLNDWAKRRYIAGTLPNTPENLVLWIRNPQTIEPGTAMPDMGVTRQDALDMSAFLYLVGRGELFE